MRATYIYGAGDVRVVDVPDPAIEQPTDAIVRVTAACVCGSDLHPFHTMPETPGGRPMGHEFVGVVEETGADVVSVRPGDVVIAPFVWSDGTCDFCREGLQTSCRHGGIWGQLPGTGGHAAVTGGVAPGKTVTVIGDGAVGLLAVLSARQLGAERIVLMGRHAARTDLGRAFGATDVVAERGAEGAARVKDLTGGDGTHVVLEAVGYLEAYEQALACVRPGGTISRVGVPQYRDAPAGRALFMPNVTLTGGVAPVRAYLERLLPGVLDGTVDPGRVFDRTVSLDETPEGYRAMDAREALKVLVRP